MRKTEIQKNAMRRPFGWVAVVLCSQVCVPANDWPSWRGPEQSGLTRENGIVTSWSQDGENLLWKVPVGGRTTPVVHDGRVYSIGPVGERGSLQERVICLDANTGRTIWEYRFNVFHTDIVMNRVGWTSVAVDPETGNVYAHGTGGEMLALDRDGGLIWSHSMTEEFGRISGYGGRLMTPVVDENRVVVSYLNSSWGRQAMGRHRYVAFDKINGDVLWWSTPGGKPLDTTYATPLVAVIDGVRMLIAPNADGNCYGLDARTGERLWSFKLSKRGLNTSPVVFENHVYFSHSEENHDTTKMGRIVAVDASKRGDITKDGEVWRFDGVTAGYSSPAAANGRVYFVDNSANLYALDARTGRQYWQYELGRVGKGSPVVTADGVIYVGEQNGVFHILKDEGDKCVSLDREQFSRDDNLVVELFGSPAVADGRVYFMTRYETYCLGQKSTPGQEAAIPIVAEKVLKGPAAIEAGKLQIRPAELTFRPGETVDVLASLVLPGNKPLGIRNCFWTVDGFGGRIDVEGSKGNARLIAPVASEYAEGTVTAVWQDQTVKARVRVIPSLPISVDFESMATGSVPPGWVGVKGKTKVVELDGQHVLQKLSPKKRPSPPFMRMRGYATPPIEGGCTVQADMLSEQKKVFKPDMGLINSRYRLIAMGMARKLRIDSWSPIPRVMHDASFQFKPDTWYTMIFDVRKQGNNTRVRGKIWPRGEDEPETWAIEFVDTHPNKSGSAGLYAYSFGTTAGKDGPATYFDNFQVKRND